MAGVHVAAEGAGRHDDGLLGAARADAHGAEERLDGDDDVVLEEGVVAALEVEDLEVRVGKSSARSPKPGMTAVQPQPDGVDVQDLDGEYVAGLCARHREGTGERVEAVPVEGVAGRPRRSGGLICPSETSRVRKTTVSPGSTVSTGSCSLSQR